MSKWRTAAKIDDNQAGIVEALRAIPGVTVALKHDDILVGYKGRNFWFEVKNPNTVRKNGSFTKGAVKQSQIELLASWAGQYDIVTNIDQILEIIGIPTRLQNLNCVKR